MLTRRPNGRFDREEGLNINISIFTILKYLIALAAIFPGYKLIEKTEIIIYMMHLAHPEMNAIYAYPIGKFNRKSNWKTQLNKI